MTLVHRVQLIGVAAICVFTGMVIEDSRRKLDPAPAPTAEHQAVDPRIYGLAHDATQTLAHAYLQWRAAEQQCLVGFDTTDGRYGFFVVPGDWCEGMR